MVIETAVEDPHPTGKDFFELVGEAGKGGAVGRRVHLCGEPAGQVGFLGAEGFEAAAVVAPALAIMTATRATTWSAVRCSRRARRPTTAAIAGSML